MRIKFIIGEAGTAKTTSIVRITQNLTTSYVCLAFTHSACNNMIEKGVNSKKVKTLHSFFKIMPDTTFINIPKKIPSYILIDEFSLIPVDLLENIFNKLKDFETCIVLAGDILQLPPVQDYPNIRFENINLNGECSLKDAKAIYHTLGRTILNSPYYIDNAKMLLTKNFRCGDSVMCILKDILNSGIVKNVLKSCIGLPEDTVFIASTYKNLKKLYNSECVDKRLKTRIGFIKYDVNKNYILTTNLTKLFNGDDVKILQVEEDYLKLSNGTDVEELKRNENGYFNILPDNYLTIHYAQGRGFKNVCLCVDDMFEIAMLYTGITRAKENIYFITFKGIKEIDVSDLTRPFNLMRDNIYVSDIKQLHQEMKQRVAKDIDDVEETDSEFIYNNDIWP